MSKQEIVDFVGGFGMGCTLWGAALLIQQPGLWCMVAGTALTVGAWLHDRSNQHED
jgi:hypothetical protein